MEECKNCPYGEYVDSVWHPYFTCNYPNIVKGTFACVKPIIEYENREYENPQYKSMTILEYIEMKKEDDNGKIY